MRKTCRWLGCAAVLCFTAVELSGCTSKPLISGFKLPGRKDRDEVVAQKDQKPTAKDSEDLLAQAREYEKAGDFPNASRAYREYLSGGGQPVDTSRSVPTQQVAKTKKPTNEKTVSIEDSRSREESAPTAKPKKTIARKAVTAPPPEQNEDPWMNESAKRPAPISPPQTPPDSLADSSDQEAQSSSKAKPPLDSKQAAAETPAWANPDTAGQKLARDTTSETTARREATDRVSQKDLDDLLDLDEGAIDWGDEPVHPETAVGDVEAPAGDQLPVIEGFQTEIPLENLDTALDDAMAPPVAAADSPPESAAPGDTWQTHEAAEEALVEVASIEEPLVDATEPGLSVEEEFAPPVFAESDATSENTQSLVLLCKDCEPWVYAQAMKLESSSADIRKEGLTNLAEMGSTARQASAAVRTLLQDPDPLVQAHAAWAIWEIENDRQDSVGTLRPLLDHSNIDVVQLACYMLGDIGAPAESCADALELLRDHAEGTTRVHAAEALIRIQGVKDKSVNVLTAALKSRDAEERWIAAVALGRCRGERSSVAVTALTAALKDIDPEVRSAAALSLGGLGKAAEKASPELERVARMDDPQVRDAARAALACLKR